MYAEASAKACCRSRGKGKGTDVRAEAAEVVNYGKFASEPDAKLGLQSQVGTEKVIKIDVGTSMTENYDQSTEEIANSMKENYDQSIAENYGQYSVEYYFQSSGEKISLECRTTEKVIKSMKTYFEKFTDTALYGLSCEDVLTWSATTEKVINAMEEYFEQLLASSIVYRRVPSPVSAFQVERTGPDIGRVVYFA